MCCCLNHACSLLNLIQLDVLGTDNGQDDTVCAVDGAFQQRRLNCHLCSFLSLVLAGSRANAHVCKACALHDGGNIGKVQVDETRNGNQFGDRSHCLMQDIICDFKCVFEADLLIRYILQALVRNNDQGVNIFLELINACVCLFHALLAFKTKRSGNNADSQNAHFPCDLCDNRCTAGTRAAAHACGDKYHVSTFQCLVDILAALFCSLAADLRTGACALSLGQLGANLNLYRSFRTIQRLLIGIDCNKLNTLQTAGDHSIHRVIAAAANTDNLDVDNGIVIHFKLETHV